MSIYRGAGGSGDAVNDASSEAVLVQQLANEAQDSADAAAASSTAASSSASAAASSASSASTSASNAATSATNAANSASSASTSATNAANSATAAQTAKTAAELAETNAETAQAAAASSASAASTSASNAATSATNASNSASSASTSATNASNSASAASTSATNAANSATSAATSASTATTQASNASTSATNAASSATSAAGSATTATTQASIATTKAGEAATSATNAATSATNASNSATAASTSATNASNSASSAATSASNAAASYDSFDDRYLGAKSVAPTVDNDGNTLLVGALYFNTVSNFMKVWDGSSWLDAYASLSGALLSANNLSDLTNAATARSNLGVAIGTNVQAYDAQLADVAGLTPSDNNFIVGNGTNFVTESGATARTSLGLGSIATQDASNVTVTGGSINGTPIGASTASTGRFSDLTDTGLTATRVTYAGTGGNLVDSANLTFDGTTLTAAGLSDSGNLTFTGTGNRIRGDFSNATVANRVAFQTSTTNGNTAIPFIPNGTGTTSSLFLYNGSDTANASFLNINNSAGASAFNSTISGTGTYLPMIFLTGGSERLRIDTSGNVGIGTSSPAQRLDATVSSATEGSGLAVTNSLIDGYGSGISFYSTASDNTKILAGRVGMRGTGSWANTANASSAMAFSTASAGTLSERMRIDSAGNVLVGTTSSIDNNFKLQLNAGASAVTGVGVNNNGGYGVYLNYDNTGRYGGGAAAIRNIANSPLVFETNNTERMRIDSSGNVVIGTTASLSSYKTTIQHTSGELLGLNASSGTLTRIAFGNADASFGSTQIIANSTALALITGSAERMRIDSSGNVLVGRTSTSVSSVGYAIYPTGYTQTSMAASTNASTTYDLYSTGAGLFRFYVGLGGTIYATNTTITALSDQRLKENIQDIDVGLDKVMALKPRKFDWKDGKGKDKKGDRGWIAQEFEQVFPEMIDEWKDPAPEGEEPYKSVNADLIPVLVKAIQELKAIVDQQSTELDSVKAELAILKGN